MATIADTYRRTRKIPDLPWNRYVCRPIAAVLVHAIRNTAITPNQITLCALGVAAISAGLLLTWPGPVGLAVAILVFEASYVLDCADGMLARLRGEASVPGHLLDFLMDEIKAFVVLAAAALRLAGEHSDARYLQAGLFGLVALATGVALTTFLRRPEIAGDEGGRVASPPTRMTPIGLVEGAARFLIHYPSYIWAAALAGHLEAYLVPYVAVNGLYAARTLLQVAFRFGRASGA